MIDIFFVIFDPNLSFCWFLGKAMFLDGDIFLVFYCYFSVRSQMFLSNSTNREFGKILLSNYQTNDGPSFV